MKKIIFSGLALLTLLTYSCSKDSEDTVTPPPPPGGNTCDTVNMKYAANIVPILQANCYSCHGTNSNIGSNGIILEGHANILPRVTNGVLIGAITHASGFTPMPQNAAKLSDCNINKIRSWINHGAQDN